jgi:hypothetical protein
MSQLYGGGGASRYGRVYNSYAQRRVRPVRYGSTLTYIFYNTKRKKTPEELDLLKQLRMREAHDMDVALKEEVVADWDTLDDQQKDQWRYRMEDEVYRRKILDWDTLNPQEQLGIKMEDQKNTPHQD